MSTHTLNNSVRLLKALNNSKLTSKLLNYELKNSLAKYCLLKISYKSNSVVQSDNLNGNHRKFNVLNNGELIRFKRKISSIVDEDKKLEEIFKRILESKLNASSDVYLEPPDDFKQKVAINKKKEIEILNAKLKFKLGWIITNLRKLTNACDKKFLNDSTQFQFLTNTLLNHLNEKKIEDKDDDEIELELDLLGLKNVDFGSEYDINKDAAAVSFNPDKINQWNFFNSFNDFDDSNFVSAFSSTPVSQPSDNENKLNTYFQFNSILIDHGRSLSDHENLKLIDYTEDIVGSIENEVQSKIIELKFDFPLIDKYIKEIRMIIAKEWIGKFENSLTDAKIKTNETEEK